MTTEKTKDLDYWRKNAEEDYMTTPISVLKYITELEQQVKSVDLADVGGSLPDADIFEDVICEIDGKYKEMTEYRILVDPDSEDDKKMRKLFG